MEAISNDLLNAIASNLNGRERQVLEMRLGIGVDRAQTLSEIGEHLNISRERVRQIQKRALSQVGNPILNSMLLVGDLVNPDSVASKKWSKKS
jgi:RNA polymerase sigma factor (sigma-70 family)